MSQSRKPGGSAARPPTREEQAARTREQLSHVDGAALGYRLHPWWWLVAAVACLLVFLIASWPDPYLAILIFVRDGLVVTIILTLASFVFIILVGLLGG